MHVVVFALVTVCLICILPKNESKPFDPNEIPFEDRRPVAWRWKSLKCWKHADAVPCSDDSDCVYPCRWKWRNATFPVKCGGEPEYCMMNLAGHLPSWLLDRNDGSVCCWKPPF